MLPKKIQRTLALSDFQSNNGENHNKTKNPIMFRFYTFLLFFYALVSVISPVSAQQGLKCEVISADAAGYDGDVYYFAAQLKVLSGKLPSDGVSYPVALPLPNGTFVFAALESYDEVAVGQKTRSPVSIKILGNSRLKAGQHVVSPDLAVVKIPANRNFQCQSNYAFLDSDPTVLFSTIGRIKGYAKVGDEISYVNDRGQKGSGKILSFEVQGGHKPDCIFEGIVENGVTMRVKTNGIDMTNAAITLGKMTPAVPEAAPNKASKSKHRVKTIPTDVLLENKSIKINIHNLIKFNPDSTDGSFDIFKVDYTLDYYIVDATVENKTDQPLDAGEYLVRLNFFTPDGQSADTFLSLLREGKTSNDPVKQDASKVDVNIFGGTSKIPLAGVLVKYQDLLPDYNTKHKPQTDALYKPLASRQKVRSVEATIMGVPSGYRIEGIGTWSGAFFNKKNLLFSALKL
jgi:hypothetical protein